MKAGTYTYKHPVSINGGRSYQKFIMRVSVVAEKGNRYQIKYHGQHASGAAIGGLHWVRKDKVKLDIPEDRPEPIVMPQQLIDRDIRLPYKD